MDTDSRTTIEATSRRRREIGAKLLALLAEDKPWQQWPLRMREEVIGQEATRFVEETE